MVAEVAMAMAEAASMGVVVAVVTMPARSSRRWSRLVGRRQLPPRDPGRTPFSASAALQTRNEPLDFTFVLRVRSSE